MRQEYVEVGGVVRDGTLTITHRAAMTAAIARFPDGEVTIHIEVAKPKRSQALNRYWWAVVVAAFSEHCGEYPEDMHEILKLQLLPKEVVYVDPETGEVKTTTIGRSTTTLTNAEFKDLILKAQHLGATLGIDIPDPNELAA
jgi:hypothetical protein